jgi:hypothetical protein
MYIAGISYECDVPVCVCVNVVVCVCGSVVFACVRERGRETESVCVCER